MWGKGTLAPLVTMQIGTAAIENTMEVPQKLKLQLPHDPAISLLIIYPKKMKTLIWKDVRTPMFIAWLFTTCVHQQNEWIKKIWLGGRGLYIHTHTERNITKLWKKNRILAFLTTQIKLEGIMLSETSQRKTNTLWFHFIGIKKKTHKTNKIKLISTENRLVVAGMGVGVGARKMD